MKLLQLSGPFSSGQTINIDSKADKKIHIGIQIPYSNPSRYIEEDFYEKDEIVEFSNVSKKTKNVFSYLNIENDKISIPHWLEKQYKLSEIKNIMCYTPINEDDIEIQGLRTSSQASSEIRTINAPFKVGERNILEFDLRDGQSTNWSIVIKRDLPYNSIIDIMYEEKGEQ